MSWGFHRNDPAIRVTHVPTGITALCNSERSQHRNKAIALQALRAKLYAKAQGQTPVQPPDGFVEPAGSYLDSVVDLTVGLPDDWTDSQGSSTAHASAEQVMEDIKVAINRLARMSGMEPPYKLVTTGDAASTEPVPKNPEIF